MAKGKKIVIFTLDETNREEILSAVMGRSGNLRAPTLKIGNLSLVGFNDEMYGEVLNE